MMDLKLLTETEAANMIGCSRSKLKQLRLTGRMPYIPGRPVLMHEADVTAYAEAEAQALKKLQPKRALGRGLIPEQISVGEARRLALNIVNKPKRYSPPKP